VPSFAFEPGVLKENIPAWSASLKISDQNIVHERLLSFREV
jgi:hypothetical protein